MRLRSRVSGVRVDADGVKLATTTGVVRAKYVVNCAGLQADRIARSAGASEARDLRIVPFRGEYYDLVPSARHMLKNLIYPVPDPAFPFLGVHFTRRLGRHRRGGPQRRPGAQARGLPLARHFRPRHGGIADLAWLPAAGQGQLADRSR